MIAIRITRTAKRFKVSVDQYPEITFSAKSYEEARDKAVELIKKEFEKNAPLHEEPEKPTKVKLGFVA